MMEGSTGYDTEFTVAGEPVPIPQFGFVDPKNQLHDGAQRLDQGRRRRGQAVLPAGRRQLQPVQRRDRQPARQADRRARCSRSTTCGNGDQAVWVGRGAADGSFTIPNVPDGNYQLTWWDEPQNYILQLVNVTVSQRRGRSTSASCR